MKDSNITPLVVTTPSTPEPEQAVRRMMNELKSVLNQINMDEKVIRLAKAGELDELVEMVRSNFSGYIRNTDYLDGYESSTSSSQIRTKLAQLVKEENWGEIRNQMWGHCFERLPTSIGTAILCYGTGARTAFVNHWCGEAA